MLGDFRSALSAQTKVPAELAGLKSILVTTDFSPASLSVLPLVSMFAKHQGSKVYLVHIIPSQPCPLTFDEVESTERLWRESQREIEDLSKAAELSGIPHESILADGYTAGVISKIVQERDINMVAAVTHGRRGLKRFVLGSVAEEIIRTCPCPVLTVGPHLQTAAPSRKTIRQILYPTDLSGHSLAAAQHVLWLAHEYRAAVTILHVSTPRVAEDADRSQNSVRSKVQARIGPISSLRVAPEFAVVSGDPTSTILQFAKSSGTDMIVLGVREAPAWTAHRLGNIVYKILTQAECPVLTVRGCAQPLRTV